jgi:branched-chain amino acid transport system substrate-binding protein
VQESCRGPSRYVPHTEGLLAVRTERVIKEVNFAKICKPSSRIVVEKPCSSRTSHWRGHGGGPCSTKRISGPLTGQNAQYGAQWKKGFDLALQEINKKGVGGRPLQYVFEDSQADPRQFVAIAQKFVSDPKIVVEVGDFSSTASMAASSIYQRAGLVQFGFTNSHPNFTKGGDYIWSNSVSQADEQPRLAKYAQDLGLKRLAVLYLNTDRGRASQNLFVQAAKANGAEIVASEGYQPDEKDFRSTLVRVRDAKPDGIILISYYLDGALIARQIRSVGLTTLILASGSVYSPKFLELAGEAANGVSPNRISFQAIPVRRSRPSSRTTKPNSTRIRMTSTQ